MVHIGKIIILSFEDGEEEALERVMFILANEVHFEPMQVAACPVLQYPGLEIRLEQRMVLRDGEEVALTRHEYGVLTFLTAYPGRVLSKQQIFEGVWHMDSESCQSSVVNVIYNLRKKIEPDSRNPVYIKTVLGVGYKFDMQRSG